ncbi:MAG: SAM-dependent methyltransferase [Bacteroidetes bacterium]|nr:SAM-dependent methyltransferase [Bacteroidota bacterium]
MSTGKLFLIPTYLGQNDPDLIPEFYKKQIKSIRHFVVENEKPARAFLKSIGTEIPQDDLILFPLNKHTDLNSIGSFLEPALTGSDMGLMSDAGLPCVADPGFQMVRLAHKKGIPIIPFHGLSSIMMALMASGFTGQQFRFHGYLPHDKTEKKNLLKEILPSVKRGETQIFIETPYRNEKIIEELKLSLPGEIELCVGVDISLPSEQIIRKPLKEFTGDLSSLHKRPAVFVVGK